MSTSDSVIISSLPSLGATAAAGVVDLEPESRTMLSRKFPTSWRVGVDARNISEPANRHRLLAVDGESGDLCNAVTGESVTVGIDGVDGTWSLSEPVIFLLRHGCDSTGSGVDAILCLGIVEEQVVLWLLE